MRKNLVLAFLLLGISVNATFAQSNNGAISGTIIDNDTKTPIEQATVQLLSLPDSTYIGGVASLRNGSFNIPSVKAGKYLLKVSFIGYQNLFKPIQTTAAKPKVSAGQISLHPDAIMLQEAVVTAEAPQVTVVEDTLMYNSSAYRTPEGAMLEELVKKLPGAELDADGNIKINGKDVKKIMVDGKEFFGGDVKTGLKNLPVDMIDKLKTYDKKSDLARITGIDDGEEETVLDLTVKKGMNQGWFGNADLAAGTKDRYAGRAMLNRFVDKTQFSLIGSANNVNDQGFSGGGGGGPMWRSNNGLNATKSIGVNVAMEKSKIEWGGSARYNYRGTDVASTNSSERFLQNGNSYSNSNNGNRNKNMDFNADFRLEWKPDTMTNIIFRPNISYGKTDNSSRSESGTFNKDPYSIVTNPNEYLNFDNLADDPLKDIRVNATNSNSLSDGKNLSANGTLQFNRKLNNRGRNITFRGTFGYGDKENDQYSNSETRYYQLLNHLGNDSILYRNQYITTPTQNFNYGAQVTYSEPLTKSTFLQFSYQFQYKYSKSDKTTYDLNNLDWGIGEELPSGYDAYEVDSLSKDAEYRYYNHDISTSLRFIREKYQLSVGMSLQPQYSKLSYKKGDYMVDTTRTVFNFTPNVDFRFRFSKVSQLRFTYRGRANQPTMENLLPIVDNANPLNIRVGNPGLKPSFEHSMRMFYNTYNADAQRGIMTHASFSTTQNSITNSTRYNEETGGLITKPENINGNWRAFAMFGFNTALKNKKFTINTFSRANYNNNVAYLYNDDIKDNDKNKTTGLTLAENVNGAYRNDWFEFSLNGSIEYTAERNKLRPENNQEPYTFAYGASTQVTLPWQMTLSTNVSNNNRRGYRDASMNRSEVIWNAQLAQSLLKGSATVSFEVYDILQQQSNISRVLNADTRSVSEYNGVNSYCMVHFIYRLNIFGNKEARQGMRGGSGHDGQGRGGFRSARSFGGGRGHGGW